MANNDIWLGPAAGSVLLTAFGRKFERGTTEPNARIDRTASGRLVKDLPATKEIFTLTYSPVENTTLVTLQGYYDLNTSLELKVQTNAGIET